MLGIIPYFVMIGMCFLMVYRYFVVQRKMDLVVLTLSALLVCYFIVAQFNPVSVVHSLYAVIFLALLANKVTKDIQL